MEGALGQASEGHKGRLRRATRRAVIKGAQGQASRTHRPNSHETFFIGIQVEGNLKIKATQSE